VVITAAGNLEHARLVDLVAREFDGAARSGAAAKPTPPETRACVEQRDKKELEQVHIVLGVPSYPLAHERRYAASLLNVILGGGMSSRLFQNIRERQGLAHRKRPRPIRIQACFGVRRNFRGIRDATDSFRVRRIPVCEERSECRRIAPRKIISGSMMLCQSQARSNLARQPAPRFISFARPNAGIDQKYPQEVRAIAGISCHALPHRGGSFNARVNMICLFVSLRGEISQNGRQSRTRLAS
jgi:hypothetical protein